MRTAQSAPSAAVIIQEKGDEGPTMGRSHRNLRQGRACCHRQLQWSARRDA